MSTAPILKSWRSYATLGGTETWHPDGYQQYADRVTLKIGARTLDNGDVCRIYASRYRHVNPADYITNGFLAATVTGSVAADSNVTLTGFPDHSTVYFVVAAIFSAAGDNLGIYSDWDYVKTSIARVPVIPANVDKLTEGSTKSFFEVFKGATGASGMVYTDMGGYVRLSSDTVSPGTRVFDGVMRLSPRYSWRMTIPVRINHSQDLLDGTIALDTFTWGIGFSSGACNVVWMETRGFHGSKNPAWEFETGFTNATIQPYQVPAGLYQENYEEFKRVYRQSIESVGIWATAHDNIGGPGNVAGVNYVETPRTYWLMRPDPPSETWKVPTGEWVNYTYEFTADQQDPANSELKCYLNGNLIITLGPNHQSVDVRKRFPHGFYPHPIYPTMRLNGPEMNKSTVDIGQIRFESECPYEYAGWAASEGNHYSYDWWGESKVNLYDPDSHTLNNLAWNSGTTWDGGETLMTIAAYPGDPNSTTEDAVGGYRWGYGDKRFNAYRWPGYMARFQWGGYSQINNDPATRGVDVYLDEMMCGAAPTPGENLGRMLPIDTPPGSKICKFGVQGVQNSGIARVRLVNENLQPLTVWYYPTSIYDAPLYDLPNLTAEKVSIEISIDALEYVGDPLDGSHPAWESTGTGAMITGFEVYFTPPPFQPPAGSYQTAQTVTPTGTGDIYYTIDGSDPTYVDGTPPTVNGTLYTGAAIIVPWSETPTTLKFIAVNGGVAGDVQSATYEFYLEGSLTGPPVSLQPAVAAPSLEGVQVGTVDAAGVSLPPSVTAPSLLGVQVGSVSAASVSLTPTVTVGALLGVVVNTGSISAAAVTLRPSVSASILTGVQVGAMTVAAVTLRPSVAAPALTGIEGVSIGSISAPSTTVQILVNPPALVGVTAGTAIRAPDGSNWDLRDIYGAPLDIRAVA